jgi:hypothetical protein
VSLRALLLTAAIQLAAVLAPIAAGLAGVISGNIAGLTSVLAWFVVGVPVSYAIVDVRRRPAAYGEKITQRSPALQQAPGL